MLNYVRNPFKICLIKGDFYMKWYCKQCRTFHGEGELCPHIKAQLIEHPEWIGEAANFSTIAGEYSLITSQTLDGVAAKVNQLTGMNLTYEGTHQFARDIQVFKRLNEEAFVRKKVFASAESAKNYVEGAKPNQIKSLVAKINGSGQEVDWLREESGRLSSVLKKSKLLNKNAVGVDGVTYNVFTGEEITRTTIKASQSKGGINTNVQQVIDAVKKGRLAPNETVYGVEGTKEALTKKLVKEINYAKTQGDTQLAASLQQAQKGLNVVEKNTPGQVKQNAQRLLEKTKSGAAVTEASAAQVAAKAANGAIIGAAIGLTVSGITSYVRYKTGELTADEMFREVTEDTTKSAIVGAGVAAVTIFLPPGAIGLIGGMAVGVYLDTLCKNVLDELYGKGAYGAILDASGYVCGMTYNLGEQLEKIAANTARSREHIARARAAQEEIEEGFRQFEAMKEEA